MLLKIGEEIDVLYTVRNRGNGVTAESSWRDHILWSAANVTSQRDLRLATVQRSNGLTPNAEYTMRQTVTVPRYIFGNFWVSVRTDVTNAVYEHVSDHNNENISDVSHINIIYLI